MKTTTKVFSWAVVCMGVFVSTAAIAQERCMSDASEEFKKWKAENSKTFDELAAKYESSANPDKEHVIYNGMDMPIAAALIIESDKYGKSSEDALTDAVAKAKTCARKTYVERGVYDFARKYFGITTVLPERATRIDFEELRRGNLPGGKKAFLPEAERKARELGRKAEKILNPARW